MHLLVVANETVTGRKLIESVERRKGSDDLHVTVLAPVSQPQHGYVVYEDTRLREGAGRVPVEHVVVDVTAETGARNVLVLANETVVGKALLSRIRERAARGDASFLIISPQSDPTQAEHPEAERRLKRALAELRGEGIDAHGQVAHPDPFSAAMDAVREERVDEIIVSTFAPSRSPWLRKNLVQRLHDETKLPVEHIVFQPDEVEKGAPA